MMGSTLPFPLHRGRPRAHGRPAPSIAERYARASGYLERVRETRAAMVARAPRARRRRRRDRRARGRAGTSSARAERALATPLIECHAHVLPDGALARFPDGGDPRYVTAERRVLGRMLEAHDACGVTHALVSDSFYMESAAAALPGWSPADRARLFNDALAALIARHPDRLSAWAAWTRSRASRPRGSSSAW